MRTKVFTIFQDFKEGRKEFLEELKKHQDITICEITLLSEESESESGNSSLGKRQLLHSTTASVMSFL